MPGAYQETVSAEAPGGRRGRRRIRVYPGPSELADVSEQDRRGEVPLYVSLLEGFDLAAEDVLHLERRRPGRLIE